MAYISPSQTQHSAYSLSVYGVYSKQQPGYQCWPHCTEDHSTQLHIQVAHCTVQEHVHQMVPHRLQLVQQVVQPERGHTQRPVRLMTVLIIHGSSPEVIPQEVGPGDIWTKIRVVLDGRIVVEAQTTVQSVEVYQSSNQGAYEASYPNGYA